MFRAPVLTTDAPLRATLQRLDAMDGSDILPSSAAKVERAKALFERWVFSFARRTTPRLHGSAASSLALHLLRAVCKLWLSIAVGWSRA
jgi:hypothetical protein